MIDRSILETEIVNLVNRVTTNISDDTKLLLNEAILKESNETAKSMLGAMVENVELAGKYSKPVCQSPGYPTVYISYGNESLPEDAKKIFQEAIISATDSGLLRPSMVHPLTRKNTGNNSGIGVPNIEYEYIPDQEYMEMIISFKGCGAELGNAMKIFTVAELGKNYSGLRRFVLETVIKAGGKPCPPFGIGIGLGGQMDVASKLSRKAISTRLWTDENNDELFNKLEKELLEEINSLGIGAAGTGGNTVALAVKIEGSHTHTAIAPVAINFHCWVTRRGGVRIFPDGRKEVIF